MANGTPTLTPEQVAALMTIANNAIKAHQAGHPTPMQAGATGLTGLFCDDYQQGKALLLSFAWLLNLWPAGGAIGNQILTALLAVGDALYAQGCTTPAPTPTPTP